MQPDSTLAARRVSELSVLVATPLGKGGMGGIDRMMDALADELSAHPQNELTVTFASTRGQGWIGLAALVLAGFIARMLMARLLRRCDLLHINLASRGSTLRKIVVAQVAEFVGLPYIIHLHGAEFPKYYRSVDAFTADRIRRLFKGARRVVVLGDAWSDFLIREEIASSEKIVVLHNASPAQDSRSAPGDHVSLLFLGRLGPRKGTPQLIEALSRLSTESDWRAVLAGDGNVEQTNVALATAGLSERVRLPGWLGPTDTEELLGSSHILVLPSLAENLPMSVIEAMAFGMAIVATPVGAIPEIIKDGETGLIVPVDDVEALAAALERLIDDKSLRDRLGSAAQAFHQQHLEIERYAQRMADIWREAVA